MERFRELSGRDWWRVGGLIGAVAVVTLAAGLWSARVGVLPLLVVGVVSVVLMTRWHSRHFGFECGRCRARFQIGPLEDALSANLFEKKYVKCPACGERSWARTLVVD